MLGPLAGDIVLESRPVTTETINNHLNDIGSTMDQIAGL